ncbi:hypothetical protein RHMOL_Rhmol04G0209200 [Rhododendron molle]|uniref:Uncharacterized protein n=1 Tax=Rhododendron molle TaxID=49168 RepID=A0ACC0P582_RHOML|nr:hypothetical protein RHMOL_Rhmol04G0209200 [Rhododendron molle]
MAEHGDGSGGEVVQMQDEGASMESTIEDQTAEVEAADTCALATGGDDGEQNQQQEVGGGDVHRAIEREPHGMEEAGAMGSIAEPVGSGTMAEGPPVIGGSSGDIGGSGTVGDDLGPIGSPPRDPMRGKWAIVEGEETAEVPVTYREDDVLFRPAVMAATSSSHVPITKYDVTEHLPDEALAKLLEDNP